MFGSIKNIKEVYSYHVNVGHGNTSFIVTQFTDNTVKIIGVDCSVTDNGKRCYNNINSCIDKIKKKFSLKEFELDIFLLTHPHNDHYTGIMHLIKQKYIVPTTEIWLNNAFIMPSSFFLTIKRTLFRMGCKFFHPVKAMPINRKLSMIDIWYPDKIVIKKGTLTPFKTFTTLTFDEERNPNNASVITCFNFNIKDENFSILFTGDIEKEGWDKVKCPTFLGHVQYYCISHHGSLNGHQRSTCHLHRPITNIANCPNHIKKAILMGRDNAYPGIYSNEVLTDFNSKIVETEGYKFIELQFTNGRVTYYP